MIQNSPVVFCQYLAKHSRQYARNKYLTNIMFTYSWYCFLLTCFIISYCRISICLRTSTALEFLPLSTFTLLFWVIFVFCFHHYFCASVYHVGASNPFQYWCMWCIQMRMREEHKLSNLKYCMLRAGETAQQLQMCTTFAEDQRWVPSTYAGWLITVHNSSSRDMVVSSGFQGYLDS